MKRRAYSILLVAAVAAAAFIGHSASAMTKTAAVYDCVHARGDQDIDACTLVIRSGLWDGSQLADAYNNRGIAYEEKGLHDQAIADYTHAIALKPDYAVAFPTYNNRGRAYEAKGLYDQAIADYTQAIALYTMAVALKSVDATAYSAEKTYARRGRAYEAKGLYDQAIADFTQAIALKPDYAMAYGNRGFAFNVSPPPPVSARAGGRPMSALWPVWVAELATLVHEEGVPKSTEQLIEAIADRLAARGLEGPTRSTVQDAARAVVQRFSGARN